MSTYSSYCNEFIDQYSEDLKRFKKVNHKLVSSRQVDAYRVDMRNAELSIKDLIGAVKFKIPACDQLMPSNESPVNTAKQFIDEANLPYPIIALELDAGSVDVAQNMESIVVAKQIDDRISIFTHMKSDGWVIMHQNEGDLPIHINLNRNTFEVYISGFDFDKVADDMRQQIINWCFGVPLRAVLNLLCILSCNNSRIEDHPDKPSRLKNDMRKNKKKLPFFEYKILTIESDKAQPTGSSAHHSGSHASPRIHLRRGHIRRLKTKNVWVNSCVVGDKAKGVIQKDYLVKAQ